MSGPRFQPEEPEEPDQPARPHPDGSSAIDRSVVVHGGNSGIVSTGDNAFNVIYAHDRFVEVDSVMELPLLDPPVLPSSPAPPLFGRDDLVEQVVAQLTAGRSAQLYGPPDVGKKAIAAAVHRRLAAAGTRGHVLLPRAGAEESLDALYTRLASLFFGRNFLRAVDESMLRARAAGIRAHITLADCALGREDLARVLETFPGCTFLFTSAYPTLPEPAAGFHVQPLSRTAAVQLLSSDLGLPDGPAGLRNPQFDHVYRMTEGRPQRLRLFAQYIKTSDEWRSRTAEEPFDQPPSIEPGTIGPRQQAEALAVAVSEPARQVLVALATFGAPLAAGWCAAVTGNPGEAGSGAGSAAELYDRRLVTRAEDGTVAVTADAAAAVTALGWQRSDPVTAAEGILSLLAGPGLPAAPGEGPAPRLLLAVAQALDETREWTLLARFVDSAAPLALQSGHGRAAVQLYVLGRKAAGLSGTSAQAQHYLRTGEQTRTILEGDRVAVAAALALLATGGTGIGGAESAAHSFGHLAHQTGEISRRAGGIARRLIQFAQAKPALAVATAVAVVGATTGVVVAATSGGTPGEPAGCATALSAVQPGNERNVQVPLDLVPYYQQQAAGLSSAAAEATDPAVKSALQARADQLNTLSAAQEQAGNGTLIAYTSQVSDFSTADTDPSVVANQVSATQLGTAVEDLRAVGGVCPLS